LAVLAAAACGVGRFALSRLLNPERLARLAAEHLGTRLEIESVHLRLWPLPHLNLGPTRAFFPDDTTLTWRSADVYPALSPLFLGTVRLGRLRLWEPVADIHLPLRGDTAGIVGETAPDAGRQTSLTALAAIARNWLRRGADLAPRAAVSIHDGKWRLQRNGRLLLHMTGLEADLRMPPGALRLRLQSAADAWEGLSLNVRADADLKAFSADIDLLRLHLERIRRWPVWSPSWGQPTGQVDVRLAVERRESGDMKGRVDLAAPEIAWQRGGQAGKLETLELAAVLETGDEGMRLQLERLGLGAPAARLTGELRILRLPSDLRLELLGRQMDVAACRALVLAMAPPDSPAADIFNVLRGGVAPHVAFVTTGRSFPELGQLANMTISGQLNDGRLFIPGPDLDLEAVQGEVLISQAVLTGRGISARHADSTGHDGTLDLDFGSDHLPFRLGIEVDADLARLPPILRKVVPDAAFQAELARIGEVAGRARGHLGLDSRQGSVEVRVAASELRLAGRYDRLPMPLNLATGAFQYDGGRILASGMSGAVGASTFEGLEILIDLKRPFRWTASLGKASLDAPPWHAWLAQWPRLAKPLGRFAIPRGRIDLASLTLTGPLMEPALWAWKARGSVAEVQLLLPDFSHALWLPGARFQVREGTLTVEEARVRFLDADLAGGGRLRYDRWATSGWQAHAEGSLGSAAHQWLEKTLGLVDVWRLRTPARFERTDFSWTPEQGFRMSGAVQAPPARLGFDLGYKDQRLEHGAFTLATAASEASLDVRRDGPVFAVHFSGDADARHMAGLVVDIPFPESRLRGDLRARLHPTQPKESSAVGHLRMDNVPVTLPSGDLLMVQRLNLSAQGDRLTLAPCTLQWQDQQHTLEGTIAIQPEGYRLDLTHSANALAWGAPQPAPAVPDPGALDLWTIPVNGRVTTQLGELLLGERRWQSVEATVDLQPGDVRIRVHRAQLCGLDTPAQLRVQPGAVELSLQPEAHGNQFAATLGCLLDKEGLMAGAFDFKGNLTAAGPPGTLLPHLAGDVALHADAGRIYRFNLLGKILAVINVTEVFKGRLPDVMEGGFAYDAIHVVGQVEAGRLTLEEAVINGASVGLAAIGTVDFNTRQVDLTVLVAPLKTVDSIVSRIPVLGDLLGGSLITIPVAVTGPVDDPMVVPLAPSAVGSGMVRALRRAYNLPIRLVQPLFKD
jgi:hypothetical protein